MGGKIHILIITVLCCITTSPINGQVIASDDVILCDGQQGEVPVTLTATSYAVDLTDSNIYIDDIFGSVINMGFDFEFYGNTYNQVVLCSNNFLSFNINNAGNGSQWQIGDAIPNNGDGAQTTNGILCPWQDIYPGVNGNGTIQYATTGEAPNRVFIASFCGIPMFSCTDICYSSQIKLFETTNEIETHIAQKVLCTTWNDGAAIHGLHNENGTIAHVVTGLDGIERNYPNQWTCENDGWRFTPEGDNNYIITNIEFAPAVAGTDIIWQDEFGNDIGTGGEIVVFPAGNVTYTAGASLCGTAGDWCGFEGGIEGDDVSIIFEELSINGSETDITCYNQNNGIINIMAPDEGDWIYSLYENGVLIESIESSDEDYTFNNLSPNTYSVTVSEPTSLCTSEELTFNLMEPNEIITPHITNDILCNGDNDGTIEISISGGTSPYNTILGNEQEVLNSLSGEIVVFNNLSAGNYYFTTMDENGCLVSGDEIFFSIEEPNALTITPDNIEEVTCADAENGSIEVTVMGGNMNQEINNYTYAWTSDNGFTSSEEDIYNVSGGAYNLEITDANGCTNTALFNISENEDINLIGNLSECINNDGMIEAIVTGGTPSYTYNLISNNETIITNNSGVFSDLSYGEYSILVSDFFGCEIENNFYLNAGPNANFSVDEYEFYLSDIATLFTDLSEDDNIISWEWNFGDGNTSTIQNPSNLYTNPGNYYVNLLVSDSEGCSNEITKEITILQDYYSYSPNIFTPNGDGVNDTFSPSLLNINQQSYNLIIFDRWGNQIFQTNNYDEGWNGQLKNGENLPPDIYSYKIRYSTNNGAQKEEIGKLIMAR